MALDVLDGEPDVAVELEEARLDELVRDGVVGRVGEVIADVRDELLEFVGPAVCASVVWAGNPSRCPWFWSWNFRRTQKPIDDHDDPSHGLRQVLHRVPQDRGVRGGGLTRSIAHAAFSQLVEVGWLDYVVEKMKRPCPRRSPAGDLSQRITAGLDVTKLSRETVDEIVEANMNGRAPPTHRQSFPRRSCRSSSTESSASSRTTRPAAPKLIPSVVLVVALKLPGGAQSGVPP